MISYTTVTYYTDSYLMGRQAVISTALFPVYALKATQKIKQYTGSNIDETKPYEDAVQMCCCELAEHLYKQENNGQKPFVTSEKVGELSVSYLAGQAAEELKNSFVKGIIYEWLADTGLLYRG